MHSPGVPLPASCVEQELRVSESTTKNVLTSQLLADDPDMRDLVEEFVGGRH